MPSMYCAKWFLTLFSLQFKFEKLVRIFDIYLLEGKNSIFNLALGYVKVHESKLVYFYIFR